NFFIYLGKYYGIAFSILAAAALVSFAAWRRERGMHFLVIFLVFLFLLIMVVGPQERFLAMLVPPLAILIAALAWAVSRLKFRVVAYSLIGLFVFADLAFAVNTNLAASPRGRAGVEYSLLRRESEIWGYNQLEDYFQKITQGLYSPYTFPVRFTFVANLQKQALEKDKRGGLKPGLILFVTDTRLEGLASLWYLTRHAVYDRWPIITGDVYLNATAADPEFFSKQGFQKTVFIKAEDTLLEQGAADESSAQLESMLKNRGIKPEYVRSPRGRTAFAFYQY
ncbi:hypothetical protein D4R52_02195, partial [bacterium]